MKLDKWYKSSVENNSETPPESVWEGVQDALDIDLVWTRLDQELGSKRKKKYLWIYAAAASLFIAISVGVWLFFFSIKSIDRNNFANDNKKNADTTTVNKYETTKYKKSDILANNPDIKEDRLKLKRTINPKADKVKELKSTPVDSDTAVNIQFAIAQLEPINAKIIEISPLNDDSNFSELVKTDYHAFKPERRIIESAYLGFTGQMANTWLLSSKTLLGLQPEELTTTNISFGKNIGVLLGARFTTRLTLQSEFFWVNQNRQQYNEYLFGDYVTTALEFNYYTTTLLAKYQVAKSKNHQLLFGGYASAMQSAKQVVDNKVSSILSEYSNFDFGLIIGYEYPITIRHRLIFSPGFSVNAGLKNIFDGNEYLPTHLNKTQNFSFNVTFSIVYNIY